MAPYLNGDGSLLVLVGGEHLRFLGRDNSVSGNQLCHDSTNSFNSESEGSHIQEKDIWIEIATQQLESVMLSNLLP